MSTYSKDSQRSGVKAPYATRILEALQDGPLNTDELLISLDESANKINYLIEGLKKLLEMGLIDKIYNPKERRQYAGHSYILKR